MPTPAAARGLNEEKSSDALQFGVLGPLQLSIGRTLLALGTPQQRATLALLIIKANRAVSADVLVDAVWDQRPPPRARATLQVYISNLRRVMSDAGVDANAVVASAPPGYKLAMADHQCDLGRFIAARDDGLHAAAAGQFERASERMSAALAQWRGPVLDDLSDFQFVESFAKTLDEEKILAGTARAEAEIACGRAHAVIGDLEALTAEHPFREPLWGQLMTAYYLGHRQSDALDAYRRLQLTLADELGIDPSPPLRTLHRQILRQEPLDVSKAAQAHAEDTILEQSANSIRRSVPGVLRDADGQQYPLLGAATRIGRSADNDIVLAEANVSRHHAVITDDGTTFVITDLGSANGVRVRGLRIRTSAKLSDGDRLRIGDHEFTLETSPSTSTA